MWKKIRNSALQQSQVLVNEHKNLISSGGIFKLSCGQKEFSSSHSILFPPFLPLCWKASSPPVSWFFCKLRENVLGLKTWSQRHRLPQAPHRGVSASLWDCSRTSAAHKTVFYPKLSCNVSFWPILQWEQGGTCHWNFWGARACPSGCFPCMSTRYPQIQVSVGVLSCSLKSNIYLLVIPRVDIEPTV